MLFSSSSFLASPRPPPSISLTGKITAVDSAPLSPPRHRSNPSPSRALHWSLPAAASISFLLWSTPVNAGILSGFSGLESVPGPQLPQFDFLNKWNEDNQKKYAEFDSRFKSSTVLKELLEKSRLNKERNQKELQDKYCLRGAEWGVGDCSTEGMTQEERDEFVGMLKKRSKGD
ncbi:hypothetical protein ACMD2_21030 [Ananas comosus]|uniref:Uncharacterized protein n=1 Tax=Ananas comosus TaxID=4615 RepID=A0A199V9D7_ANACO|nr:hypothetical protein ACMD2_21030 [Ananas comosus]